jgi:hypothetical protein
MKSPDYYNINGKRYVIIEKDVMNIKVQASDVNVYGWTLEVRWKYNGDWNQWMTYWNNRIYQSRSSAMEAAIKVYPSYQKDYEWRIAPLYKMNQPEWRHYQIDQLLWDSPNKEKKEEIKAWKVKENCEIEFQNNHKVKFKKGEIFLQMENKNIIRVATYSESTKWGQGYILREYLLPKGLVEEFDIREEKWIHPHLCKELKNKLRK